MQNQCHPNIYFLSCQLKKKHYGEEIAFMVKSLTKISVRLWREGFTNYSPPSLEKKRRRSDHRGDPADIRYEVFEVTLSETHQWPTSTTIRKILPHCENSCLWHPQSGWRISAIGIAVSGPCFSVLVSEII